MITAIQLQYLKDILDGKIKISDNPRKHSMYIKRIRKTIDDRLARYLWLAEYFPEILRDREWELNNEVPDKRRAKALLKGIAMFQQEALFGEEATIIQILQEMYPRFQIELVKKDKVKYSKIKPPE